MLSSCATALPLAVANVAEPFLIDIIADGSVTELPTDFESSAENSSMRTAASFADVTSPNKSAAFGAVRAICFLS
jgi:hypothetical protein